MIRIKNDKTGTRQGNGGRRRLHTYRVQGMCQESRHNSCSSGSQGIVKDGGITHRNFVVSESLPIVGAAALTKLFSSVLVFF